MFLGLAVIGAVACGEPVGDPPPFFPSTGDDGGPPDDGGPSSDGGTPEVNHEPDGPRTPDWLPFLGEAVVGFAEGNKKAANGKPYHPWPAVDFAMPSGTPVRAAGSGVVVATRQNTAKTATDTADCSDSEAEVAALEARAGLYVLIRHDEADAPGAVHSVYKHLSEALVKPGQVVERGQVIGLSGRTAASSSHLHFDKQDLTRCFNGSSSRVDLGTLRGRDGMVQDYPAAFLPGGNGTWKTVPFGTPIRSEGFDEPSRTVSTLAALREALADFSTSEKEGPFTIILEASIDLEGGPLVYSGDELLRFESLQGRMALDGNGSRVREVTGTAPVEFHGIHLAGGLGDHGGAVLSKGDLTFVDSRVIQSSADGDGGGVFTDANVVVVRSSFQNNRAGGHGGAVAARHVTVAGSTFSSNHADGDGGVIHARGDVLVSNTTLSGNSADGRGGAIRGHGDMVARHLTSAENTAARNPTLSIPGKLVSLASVFGDGTAGAASCSIGESESLGYNIHVGTGCGEILAVDYSRSDLRLGTLRSNGGDTETHFPLAGSRLVDLYFDLPASVVGQFSPLVCDPSAEFDQRGVLLDRPAEGECDGGAIEQTFPPHGLTDVPAWL
ncbi:MAG: peptidoglycan DD-metalloendopeptidase family protein, partial [Myxococcales bacterium]|nr:peptidoglycan DD-metalloendopeptidase family protein [Myxococcales bacterium]